jgi:hypothetical protein
MSQPIRVFTCSKWNHLALRVGDQVIESIGQGVTLSPWEKWEAHADRIVLPLTPDKPVDPREVMGLHGKDYGFLDLIQILRHIKATRWDGKPKWEGKNYKGYLCSELGCILMGVDSFLSPGDFEYLAGLTKGEEFTTVKNSQKHPI